MKKVLCIMVVLSMAMGLFGCGKSQEETVDPNAIAKVVTGDAAQYVLTVEDMVKAVDPSGNTVITLLKDIDYEKTITLPTSCTIDFAGHIITTNLRQGIGIMVNEAGTENAATVLKNGTLNTYADCVRVKKGSIVVDGVTMHAAYGVCVTVLDPSGADNRITNATLASAEFGCFAWSTTDADYSGCVLQVENSELIAYNRSGSVVFSKAETAVSGRIDLGTGVNVYSFADIVATKEMWFNGSGMAKNTAEVTVNGETVSGITKWSEDTQNQVIDVLMIGNSFCWYFTEELHGVADAAGVQLNINNLYEAGCYVAEHWEWMQSDAQKYEQFWVTNDFGRYKNPENLKMSAALAYGDWDVITLQQHYGSGVKDVEAALAKVENADDIYDYLKANYPNATLYWHNTWAYQVGHENMPSTADQTLRQNNINLVSQTVADRNGVDQIPGGQAWAIARKTVGDSLCRSDLFHDGDVGGGQYLNACVWFEVLTGKSCIGNTWRPTTYELSEEKVIELQKAAHQAVAEMYGEDYAK